MDRIAAWTMAGVLAAGLLAQDGAEAATKHAVRHAAGPPAQPPFLKGSGEAAVKRWIATYTDLRGQTIGFSDNAVFALLSRTPLEEPAGGVRVELREEVMNAALAQTLGGRSVLMRIDLDCAGGKVKLNERQLHAAANLLGPAVSQDSSGDWIAPPADTYVSAAFKAGCASAAPAAASSPSASAAESAQPTAPSDGLRGSEAVATAQNAPADTTTPTPASEGWAVQVGAGGSEAAARHALATARTRLGAELPPLTDIVKPVTRAGHTLYRAQLAGFADEAAAKTACVTLKAAAGTCLVLRP